MWYGFNVLWLFSAGGKEPFVNPHFINIDENELDFMAEMGCNFVRLPTDYRFSFIILNMINMMKKC